ncbi:HelD family protein [Alkalicoccobacillus porphyridii]|uniref:HelD family protein n=1 Tax=Alkalicoccobacillus porphyridii TaxID=2597270 RepID=UPI00163D92A5|nr:UvrD-helicase domain-containing protein [Alkalicoccobacillus porphyridii]
MSSNYNEEKHVLTQKQKHIQSSLKTLEAIPRYHGDDFNEQVLEDSRERQRESLKKAQHEPYFGRLDFQAYEDTEAKPLYIGKTGIYDEDTGDPLILDWRAPASSLFYAFSGSEDDVYYEAPEGIIDGEIELKRNIVIRDRALYRVVDSYKKGEMESSGGDEFLLYKLGEQKDHRLRDIVSTIQGEQNEIIRHPQNKAVIIQGVAGSGKTTVALHRLAYLLYEYRESLKAEHMIIFAPNAMFLDYISQVLPELGVGHIQQTTFTSWVFKQLDLPSLSLKNQANTLKSRFEHPNQSDDQLTSYKGSLEFMMIVEKELTQIEVQTFQTEDFLAWNGAVLSSEAITNWLINDFRTSSVKEKQERLKARMKRWIEIEVNQFYLDKKEQEELRKEAMRRLQRFLSKIKIRTTLQIYQQILKQQNLPPVKNEVEPVDLAPLLHIHQKWVGIKKEEKFDHVVIDEAQDFSPYQLTVLKNQTRGQSFTILGDLSQGIHSVEGIDEWMAFKEVFGPTQTAYFEMNKSYRSTYEIIECANHILKQFPTKSTLAEPVFRSGTPVHIRSVQQMGPEILAWIDAMREQGYQSMAVMGRTTDQCQDLYQFLHHTEPAISFIQAADQTYSGGISILPVYLSKGLEFDAVLLLDVDDESYTQKPEHVKLLYVGVTRALHHLEMLYSGKLTPLLTGYQQGTHT